MKKSHLKARIIRPIVMSLFAVFLALTIMPNVSHAASPIGGSDSTLTIRKTSVGVRRRMTRNLPLVDQVTLLQHSSIAI